MERETFHELASSAARWGSWLGKNPPLLYRGAAQKLAHHPKLAYLLHLLGAVRTVPPIAGAWNTPRGRNREELKRGRSKRGLGFRTLNPVKTTAFNGYFLPKTIDAALSKVQTEKRVS